MNNDELCRIMAELYVEIKLLENNVIDSWFWIMSFREALTKPDMGDLGFLIGLS